MAGRGSTAWQVAAKDSRSLTASLAVPFRVPRRRHGTERWASPLSVLRSATLGATSPATGPATQQQLRNAGRLSQVEQVRSGKINEAERRASPVMRSMSLGDTACHRPTEVSYDRRD